MLWTLVGVSEVLGEGEGKTPENFTKAYLSVID